MVTDRIVFISHATADLAAAERVRSDLEADGIACWAATRDVSPGDDYATAITEAIASCPVLLVILTAAAVRSEHIEREVHLAVSAKAAIIPLRLEPVDLTGSLKYLLANVQHIDAFPRLEPQLALLRTDVRRRLAARGATIASTRRSPFQQVAATAGAWAIVVALNVLVAEWIRRIWLNLLPLQDVPAYALQSPALALLLAAPPVAALAMQYWAHRDLTRIGTLDALFAVSPGGPPRVRLIGAGLLGAAVTAAIVLAPPAVRVHSADGGPGEGDNLVQAKPCLPSESYTVQTSSHYIVELRVGALNPPGTFALRAELAPYATADGVEFCEIWLDRGFGIPRVVPIPDDERASGYVEIEGDLERFVGRRSLLFNVRHYRDSEPSARTAVTATLARGSFETQDDQPVALPLR